MSSTTATASAPRPVESSAKPAQANARAPQDKTEGQDMFASLLGLLASTQVLPEAATLAHAPADAPANDAQGPDTTDNPFAALLGWALPAAGKDGSVQVDGNPHTRLSAAADTAERKHARADEGTIDISDMTPVDPTPVETAPKGQVALPANAVRPGAAWAPARSAEGISTASSTSTATPWRQTSLASTETASLQQASVHSAQARSTVALNERFGLTPGVPLASAVQREAAAETFSLATPTTSSARVADAAPALPGATAGDASMGSDATGSDASASGQTDGQPDNPFADANAAEEPTVTHWGTQHLRHASLRVAGEAGDAAIDIQLSMKGQEVQVAFNTDSAEARASLREHAGESLADLLGRSGIQLGGVSVGAQGQQGSRGDDGAARQNGMRETPASNDAATLSDRRAQIGPRADGSQPLDVFA